MLYQKQLSLYSFIIICNGNLRHTTNGNLNSYNSMIITYYNTAFPEPNVLPRVS